MNETKKLIFAYNSDRRM